MKAAIRAVQQLAQDGVRSEEIKLRIQPVADHPDPLAGNEQVGAFAERWLRIVSLFVSSRWGSAVACRQAIR